MIKDELGRRIMKEFVRLRTKTYNYLIDQDSKDKKAKGIKRCIIKRKPKFEDYKNFLEASQLKNKIHHLEKNKTDVDSLKNITKNLQKVIN